MISKWGKERERQTLMPPKRREKGPRKLKGSLVDLAGSENKIPW